MWPSAQRSGWGRSGGSGLSHGVKALTQLQVTPRGHAEEAAAYSAHLVQACKAECSLLGRWVCRGRPSSTAMGASGCQAVAHQVCM